MDLKSAEKLLIFSRYIGQQVVIRNLLIDDIETIGTLIGIKENALLINIDNVNRWVPLSDELELCDIKLILKPLKKLTSTIIDTANSLPVQAFITPYYQSLGFDMPVYIAPGHPLNCNYVVEVNLADYRTIEEIANSAKQLMLVHG
ncbi:hypothetical protein SAMN05216490_1084 [Mucilaginibacter mallensis]|uniref:Uncharacterized protein n=1 Tax=Mucilaginibacter mallensis TaxID=652787 RepID=A0A1H1RW26_MUCMA|nr:hypothetical protein [Mucilaginibacter mallensis]SDS39937.1 hypothetical protein SAMN05216490_1084 [Mucilaginibacter mallensis]